jgi:hypothetical protein
MTLDERLEFHTPLLLLAVSALAADIDGKWTGSISTPNGDFPLALHPES